MFFKNINGLNGLFKQRSLLEVKRHSLQNHNRSTAVCQVVVSHRQLTRGKIIFKKKRDKSGTVVSYSQLKREIV